MGSAMPVEISLVLTINGNFLRNTADIQDSRKPILWLYFLHANYQTI